MLRFLLLLEARVWVFDQSDSEILKYWYTLITSQNTYPESTKSERARSSADPTSGSGEGAVLVFSLSERGVEDLRWNKNRPCQNTSFIGFPTIVEIFAFGMKMDPVEEFGSAVGQEVAVFVVLP